MSEKASRQNPSKTSKQDFEPAFSSAAEATVDGNTSLQRSSAALNDTPVDLERTASRSNSHVDRRKRVRGISGQRGDSPAKSSEAFEQAAAAAAAQGVASARTSRLSSPTRIAPWVLTGVLSHFVHDLLHHQRPIVTTDAAASTSDARHPAATSLTTSGISEAKEVLPGSRDPRLPEPSLGENFQPTRTEPFVAPEAPPIVSAPEWQSSLSTAKATTFRTRRKGRTVCPPPQQPISDLLEDNCLSSHPRQGRFDVPNVAALATPLIVVLSVGMLFLVFLLLTWNKNNGGKVCETPGCEQHARALGINDSRSPSACEDFSAFICTGWELNDLDVFTTVNSQAFLLWILSVERRSLAAYDREAVVNRPLNMMRACIQRVHEDAEAVKSLVELVDRSSFAWPTQGNDNRLPVVDYSRSLQLLLELSVVWALPLWFRVRVLPANSPLQQERAVVLSGSALPNIWHGLYQTLLLYEDAYSIYLKFFNNSIFKYRPPSESFALFLRTSMSMQTQVLSQLSSAFYESYEQPRLVEIRSMPRWIRNVSAEDWVKALGTVYGTQQNISATDLLLATNENLLRAADSIFTNNTAQDVFFHTIWLFVQSVGAATSNDLFFLASKHPLGKHFQRVICFDHVATTYNVLLASLDKDLLPSRVRLSIVGLLENIRAVALEKVRSYSKLNTTTRKALAAVLESMSTVIWPEDDFGRTGAFKDLYGEPYRGKGGFFGEWKWSRLQMQNRSVSLLNSEEYIATAEVYSVVSNRLVTYNPVRNTMSVSVAALSPPFYYKDATNAMMYAGLGYLYAQEIFEALDMVTHLFNGEAVMKPSDEPETSAFWNGSWCPVSVNNKYTFPELPALDVAYTAYVRFKDQASDLPLKGLEHLSPAKIFFATFCHCNCYFDSSKRVKLSEVCNAAVQHFDAFAEVFSCPAGTNMNKSPKCAYI